MLIFVLLLAIAGGLFYHFRHNQTAKTASASSTANNTTATIHNTTPTSSFTGKIPILMYHYIRDYNDPTDKIGVNLSVSPVKFAAQLDYLKSKGYKTITFQDVENNNIPARPVILTFDDGYIDFYQNAYPVLKSRQMVAVSYIITSFNGGRYMDNNQIKEIASYGIEIGSHTISHPDLTTISPAKAQSEIANSKSILENIIGKPVISFCHPSGKYNDAVIKLVQDAGYKYATTTNPGMANFNVPLTLSRYRINPDTNVASILK